MTYIKQPSIVWQKWVDPFFGPQHIQTHDTLEDMLDEPEYVNDLSENNNIHENEEDNIDDEPDPVLQKERIKAIITPMGIIPMDEYSASSRIFNFWVGHTNFSISKNICDIIDTSEGVETLDIFTRYRFRIGIAKLFKPSEVMSNITHEVIEYLEKYG
jgi:hypothetical protein